jgi:uncharacterized protein
MNARETPDPGAGPDLAILLGDGRFYIGDDPAHPLAEIGWKLLPDQRIAIEHVEVSAELQGRGIGRKLVDRVVAWAREERWKVVPVCPYAESVLNGSDAYRDVLA